MGCSPSDLKDYYFGELPPAERRAVDEHLAACGHCREQLDGLELTGMALLSVRDEEMPRRIAFVSDKVFEPNWWQRIWSSNGKLGFASAAVLAGAIVAHGFITMPHSVQLVSTASTKPPTASIQPASTAGQADEAKIEAEVARRVQSQIAQIVTASEQRQAQRIEALRADQKKNRGDLEALGESVMYLQKTAGAYMMRASMNDVSGGAGQ